MPCTDTRTVIDNYWYTSAQIADVGRAWEESNDATFRFIYSERETPNQTGFNLEDFEAIGSWPRKILLPLNKGNNHWVAIVIDADKNKDELITVNISYTDSLNSGKDVDALPENIQAELTRINSLITTSLANEAPTININIYEHTWQQPDGASCGPYAMANAMRCLNQAGSEENPGRTVIRQQQLNAMVSATAIKGCSTHNKIDEILMAWILERVSKKMSISILMPEDVEAICSYYAEQEGKDVGSITQIFHNEYCELMDHPYFRPVPVNIRVRELIREFGLIKIIKANAAEIEAARKDIAKENIALQIDKIRAIFAEIKNDESVAYLLMSSLTHLMHHRDIGTVEQFLIEHINQDQFPNALSQAQVMASKIIGARAYADQNDSKFIRIASCYQCIHEVSIKLRSPIDCQITQDSLKALVVLLNGAIARNDAALIGQVGFIIQDFMAILLQIITLGYYEPEYVRIAKLADKFKKTGDQVSSDQYRSEIRSFSLLLDAKVTLDQEIGASQANNRLLR